MLFPLLQAGSPGAAKRSLNVDAHCDFGYSNKLREPDRASVLTDDGRDAVAIWPSPAMPGIVRPSLVTHCHRVLQKTN